MTAYYNEIDPFAAQWLRELIKEGHIAHGEVDERSIVDIRSADLDGFTQCHFFAGIGVWSHALRSAGWADDRPVWTGSCPCQPFSAAGKGDGFDDERHLWPHFHWLINQCRPAVVLGEQVASKDGLAWLDLVQADLEGSGYASAAADMCAAGIGAPHIRQRLYWLGRMADTNGSRQLSHVRIGQDDSAQNLRRCNAGGLVHPMAGRNQGQFGRMATAGFVPNVGMADDRSRGREVAGINAGSVGSSNGERKTDILGVRGSPSRPSPTNGFWRDADWLFCRDGKWRPVEPGTFPLAHGAPARVGRLRGYGNAINAQQAQTFIEAVMEV